MLDTPQEAAMINEAKRIPANWPTDKGGVVVENLTVAYAPSLPPVLKNLSFVLSPREKVGVVSAFNCSLAIALD